MSSATDIIVTSKPLSDIMDIVKGMLTMQTFTMTNEYQMEVPSDVAIPFLQGPPGIGKTAITQQMCWDSGFDLLSVHYGLKPLEDVSGLPDLGHTITINGETVKTTKFTTPDLVGMAWDLHNKNIANHNEKMIVVFLDDFHMAQPLLKSLGYEMFTAKTLRNYPFPPKTSFLLAGNMGKKAGAEKIPSPIVNRVALLDVSVSFSAWKNNFAIANGVNNKIINFLSNPKYKKFFQMEEQIDKPWASARSWTRWSTLLNSMEKYTKVTHNDVLYYGSAHVGADAGGEFAAYYKLYGEIDAIKIIKGEIEPEVPSNMTNQYVFTLACIGEFFNLYANTKDTNKRDSYIQKLSEIVMLVAKQSREIAITGLREIIITETSLRLRNIYSKLRAKIQIQDENLVKNIHDDAFQIRDA